MTSIESLISGGFTEAWLSWLAGKIFLCFREIDKDFDSVNDHERSCNARRLTPRFRPELRQNLIEFLSREPGTWLLPSPARLINSLFIIFFGERHWNWHCFRRSNLWSAMFLIGLMYVLVNQDAWNTVRIESVRMHLVQFGVLAFSVMISIVQDYFSLWKARLILDAAARPASRKSSMFWLSIDIALSAILGVFFSSIATLVVVGYVQTMLGQISPNFHDFICLATHTYWQVLILPAKILVGRSDDPYLADMLESASAYSAFFTSVWTVLFSAAALILWTVWPFRYFKSMICKVYNVQDHPFEALGALFAVIWFVVGNIAMLVLHDRTGS